MSLPGKRKEEQNERAKKDKRGHPGTLQSGKGNNTTAVSADLQVWHKAEQEEQLLLADQSAQSGACGSLLQVAGVLLSVRREPAFTSYKRPQTTDTQLRLRTRVDNYHHLVSV